MDQAINRFTKKDEYKKIDYQADGVHGECILKEFRKLLSELLEQYTFLMRRTN